MRNEMFQRYCMSILFVLGLSLSVEVSAESTIGKRYVGANLGLYTFDGDDSDADLTSIEGRIGGFLNDNAAVEARLGIGFIGEEIQNRDVDLDYSFGAYARIGAPAASVFPYVLLGYSRASVSFSNPDVDDSETDLSYGVGVDVNALNLTLNFEYVSFVSKNNIDLEGFTFGFTSTF